MLDPALLSCANVVSDTVHWICCGVEQFSVMTVVVSVMDDGDLSDFKFFQRLPFFYVGGSLSCE